jgi:acetoin utilization deacetylase AcuC-like enzyme
VRLANRIRRWWYRRDVLVWYAPEYRLPLASLEGQVGLEPRRADLVTWFLLDRHVIDATALRSPRPASYEDLGRVHSEKYLEALSRPATLARIFAVDERDVPVDELLHTIRLGVGGTIEAARTALRRRAPMLNLLGGFHHAYPASGAGFCPLNDVAIAVATLRHEGFRGRVAILDLDAHPPDGTAACFAGDDEVWIGSLSGADWGGLPNVDETRLGRGTGDEAYLEALDSLLKRRPSAALVFVVAGGDVLAHDRLGGFALTLDGVRQRDLRVSAALGDTPSVWLPGGGYSADAWRALAGTALALALRSGRPIPPDYDPLVARFAAISSGLRTDQLVADDVFDAADLVRALGLGRGRGRLLLDFYSAEGAEHALFRFGILGHLARLGYHSFRVELDDATVGDRFRLKGSAGGVEHVLIESVVERRRVEGREVLYIHWLTMRHPRASFDAARPALPGQEVPGLGLAREASETFARMARRLGLAGVAFRPAWFHMAYAARHLFRFVDPARQGRFEALVRDLAHLPLVEATEAVAEGRVRLDGARYAWEADEMVFWLDGPPAAAAETSLAERERARFTVVPREPGQPPPPPVRF